MDRRRFLASATAAALWTAVRPSGRTSPQSTGKRPNVLLLMSDQHKRSCMGAYGDPIARTPNLDWLA
jgi:choline-sulfatase